MSVYKCAKCCGVYVFSSPVEEPHCVACDRPNQAWTERLQRSVSSVEFYSPKDSRSPVVGCWVCLGPTSEMTTSVVSIEHAALLFLANIYKDVSAIRALRASARPS